MRDGSTLFFTDMLKASREEQELCLVTITGDMPQPIRIVSDTVPVTSRGHVFLALPFGWQRPSEGEVQNPGRLVIENVSQEIGETVRLAKGHLHCLMEFVLRSEPDQVLADFRRLRLKNARVRGIDAVFDIGGKPHGNAAWPGTRATPELCPGLFA